MQVYVDPKDSGEWTPCVNVSNLAQYGLTSNWLQRSHIGLTASTGQLADNHDILYMKSYSDAKVLEAEEAEDANKAHFELEERSSVDQKFQK